MSCVIAISDQPEGVWGIRNTIYAWFVSLAKQRFEHDELLREVLEDSEHFQSLGLYRLRQKDATLAYHVADSLLTIAREVAAGKHPLMDCYGKPWPELQVQTEASFANLVVILVRFQQHTHITSFDEKG